MGVLNSAILSDKVAIITGGSQGIGRAIALTLAHEGAKVVVASRNKSNCDEVVSQILKTGGIAISVQADMREKEAVSNMVQRTLEQFGRIDILVNNAGGPLGGFTSFVDLKESNWDELFQENLKPVFLCTNEVAPIMIKQKKGNIISISSIVAQSGAAKLSALAAAKAAIINLTKTLAAVWAPYGIRVNCIAPGFIATESPSRFRSAENLAEMLKWIPAQRFGRPEDIAKTALFLVSDDSDYITGQTIVVDGGWSTLLATYFFE